MLLDDRVREYVVSAPTLAAMRVDMAVRAGDIIAARIGAGCASQMTSWRTL